MSPPNNSCGQLGLSILGVGTTYPPFSLKPDAIDTLANRFHDANSTSMRKVLSINRFTGIDVGTLPLHSRDAAHGSLIWTVLTYPQTRSSIGDPDHPIVNNHDPPSIEELHNVFISDGVPLAVSAARKALTEAGVDLKEIVSFSTTPVTSPYSMVQ